MYTVHTSTRIFNKMSTILVFFRFNDTVVFVNIPMYDSNLVEQIVRPVVMSNQWISQVIYVKVNTRSEAFYWMAYVRQIGQRISFLSTRDRRVNCT